MVTLLTYPGGFGQFSLSPFCVKAARLLALSGIPWTRQDMKDPRRMPMRKLPVLRTNQGVIADSDTIRLWLESQGAVFDPGLGDIQLAQSRALIRMAEDHLYFHIVKDRWANDVVWPTIRDTYFTDMPVVIRRVVTSGIRKSVVNGLAFQGLGRFTEAQRKGRLEQDLSAIETHLRQSAFLFGDAPTSADLSVSSILGAMRSTPHQTALSRRIGDDILLSDYLDRMDVAVPLP